MVRSGPLLIGNPEQEQIDDGDTNRDFPGWDSFYFLRHRDDRKQSNDENGQDDPGRYLEDEKQCLSYLLISFF